MKQAIVIQETSKQEYQDKVNHYLEKFSGVEITSHVATLKKESFWGSRTAVNYIAIILFDK